MLTCVIAFILLIHFSINVELTFTDDRVMYMLYDVNELEGFNLRRDIYTRLANVIRILRDPKQHPNYNDVAYSEAMNWTLVLPPFGPLPHWKNQGGQYDERIKYGISWAKFFDIHSLNSFIPVIEWKDFVYKVSSESKVSIDAAFNIQKSYDIDEGAVYSFYFKDAEVKGNSSLFCDDDFTTFTRTKDEKVTGFYGNILDERSISRISPSLQCLGGILEANSLADFLSEYVHKYPSIKSVYIGNAEALIHGSWSEWSQEYWTARRSMVFASNLRNIADAYRATHLHSDDTSDRTEVPASWMYHPWPLAPALGGPYVAVHWRRGDFVHSEDNSSQYSPGPKEAAKQIMEGIHLYGLSDEVKLNDWPIFIASDADTLEFSQLKDFLHPATVFRFEDSSSDLLPGEVAIVDQWICAHARLFIGTQPSTFTLRITEERQFMGFPVASTFNTLCGVGHVQMTEIKSNIKPDCEPITVWPVRYEGRFTVPPRYQQQHATAAWSSSRLDHNPEEL